MSVLTSFSEDLYPKERLAADLQDPSAGFGIGMARALMWLSQAAYETTADPPATPAPRKLERLLARWGFALRTRLSAAGTEGFVAESDVAVVVAFSGTDPAVAANWITDFDIRTATGGLHRGFARAVQAVWPDLAAALYGDRPLFLTGHSLGGALAIIAAAQLVADRPADRIAAIVAFGTPRVGDAAFAAAYRTAGLWQKTVRLEYGSDLIPSLPPAAPGQVAWRPVGLALSCPHGGRFADVLPPRDEPPEQAALPSLDDMRRLGDAWRRRLLDHGVPASPIGGPLAALIQGMPFFLRDHLQDCYLQALGESFGRPMIEPAQSVAVTNGGAPLSLQDLHELLRRILSGQ